jgi:hypothetical protein
MSLKRCLSTLLFILIWGQCDKSLGNLIVSTKNGLIRGREAQTIELNLTYYAYQGIPFAEPPVGNLRFEVIQYLLVFLHYRYLFLFNYFNENDKLILLLIIDCEYKICKRN